MMKIDLNTYLDSFCGDFKFEISRRLFRSLYNANVRKIIDVVTKSEEEILRIKHLGVVSLNELETFLEFFDLKLNMTTQEIKDYLNA